LRCVSGFRRIGSPVLMVSEALTHNALVSEQKSQGVRDFRERALPETATLAGYAALIEKYDLKVLLPPRLAGIALRHHPTSTEAWRFMTPRHASEDTLIGHLEFALKWEGVDLAVLSALFKKVEGSEIAKVVRARPTGAYTRRLWFLYEWLTERRLDVANPGKVRAIPVVDPKNQFALKDGAFSKRHKVIDNLPGTRAFCPLVRRTAALEEYQHLMLDKRARDVIGRTHRDIMARAAAFLLLSDSQSSFWIEGERPSLQRAQRWRQIIGQAGSVQLSLEEFERLQRIVIGDARFVRLGLRREGGFVGTHDRTTNEPIPDHVSARAADLRNLLEDVIVYTERSVNGDVDPVVAAAVSAFGSYISIPSQTVMVGFTDG